MAVKFDNLKRQELILHNHQCFCSLYTFMRLENNRLILMACQAVKGFYIHRG